MARVFLAAVEDLMQYSQYCAYIEDADSKIIELCDKRPDFKVPSFFFFVCEYYSLVFFVCEYYSCCVMLKFSLCLLFHFNRSFCVRQRAAVDRTLH